MLGDVCSDRLNGFHLLRLIAALGILFAHCTLVIPFESIEASLSDTALRYSFDLLLALFFVFSGFLIAASMERNQSLLRYAAARGLRIFPGLITVTLALALVGGPMASTLSPLDYFSSLQVWNFAPQMAILVDSKATLPGVFEHHPVSGVNIPIWTLRHELVIYILFPVIYRLILVRGEITRAVTFAIILAVVAATKLVPEFAIEHASLQHLVNFSASFMIGAALWNYRNVIPNSGGVVLALWAAFAVVVQYDAGFIIGVIAAGYSFVWIAFQDSRILKGYNVFGDYSYGIYIMHFPVGQYLYQLNPTIDPIVLAFQTVSVTLPLAILMWMAIEKPALSHIKYVEAWLRGKLIANPVAVPSN